MFLCNPKKRKPTDVADLDTSTHDLLAYETSKKNKPADQLTDEHVEDEEDGDFTSGEKLGVKFADLKNYFENMEAFLTTHEEYGGKTLNAALNAWQAKSQPPVSSDVVKEVRKIYTLASRKPTFSTCLSIMRQFFESPTALHLYDDFPTRPVASAFDLWSRSHREEAGLSGLTLAEYQKKKAEARAEFDSNEKRVEQYMEKLAIEYQAYLQAVDDFQTKHTATLSKAQIRYLTTTKASAKKKLCELDPSEKERFEAEQAEKKRKSKGGAGAKKSGGGAGLKANTGFALFVQNEEKQRLLDPSLSAEDRERYYSAKYHALPQSSRNVYEDLARAS